MFSSTAQSSQNISFEYDSNYKYLEIFGTNEGYIKIDVKALLQIKDKSQDFYVTEDNDVHDCYLLIKFINNTIQLKNITGPDVYTQNYIYKCLYSN